MNRLEKENLKSSLTFSVVKTKPVNSSETFENPSCSSSISGNPTLGVITAAIYQYSEKFEGLLAYHTLIRQFYRYFLHLGWTKELKSAASFAAGGLWVLLGKLLEQGPCKSFQYFSYENNWNWCKITKNILIFPDYRKIYAKN